MKSSALCMCFFWQGNRSFLKSTSVLHCRLQAPFSPGAPPMFLGASGHPTAACTPSHPSHSPSSPTVHTGSACNVSSSATKVTNLTKPWALFYVKFHKPRPAFTILSLGPRTVLGLEWNINWYFSNNNKKNCSVTWQTICNYLLIVLRYVLSITLRMPKWINGAS